MYVNVWEAYLNSKFFALSESISPFIVTDFSGILSLKLIIIGNDLPPSGISYDCYSVDNYVLLLSTAIVNGGIVE